jgi:CheY-like chemotaxis protein
LPEGAIRLRADPTRLEQALTNLLVNAIKYTDEGGQIGMTVERVGAEVTIRVRDTGIGMAPEVLPHVFDLFVQGERRLDRAQGGLGIGLSLVKSLVELHAGSITAHSEGPGRGSEFIVRLPVLASTPAEEAGPPPPGRSVAPVALPRRRILVVDDNVDAADSLGRLLATFLGQEVRVVYDGPAALDVVGSLRPEVVLLDLGMTTMDGFEVAMRLRERPESAGMVIVAVTGWGQEEDRRRTEETGFDHHLIKPIRVEVIRDLLLGLGTASSTGVS